MEEQILIKIFTIHTTFSVNRMKDEAATAAFVKHKCYRLTSMMYYLNTRDVVCFLLFLLHDLYYIDCCMPVGRGLQIYRAGCAYKSPQPYIEMKNEVVSTQDIVSHIYVKELAGQHSKRTWCRGAVSTIS